MPGLDTSYLNAVTRDMFIPAVKNTLYNGSPLFTRIFHKNKVEKMTGTALDWAVPLRKHKALGRYAGTDTFASQQINPVVRARLMPCDYYATLQVTGDEKRRNSGNDEKLIDLIKTQTDNAISSLQESMYTDMYGDGSLIGDRLGLVGLRAVCGTSNVYANINRATAGNETWRANVDTTAVSVANLKDLTNANFLPSLIRRGVTDATHGGISPKDIYMTKALYNIYQDIAGARLQLDPEMANLGFDAVKFGNLMMTFDDFCPALHMFILSIKETITLYVYDGTNFDMPDEGWIRPPLQDSYLTQILWSGQMRCDNPWHQSLFTALGGS